MDEFKELLNQDFANFKEYHTLIIIIVNCCVVVITGILGFLFNQKLEKIKKQQNLLLSKSEKYHDLQIQAVKNIYPKIVKLEIYSEYLIYPPLDNSKAITTIISDWTIAYNDLAQCFYENELFLDTEPSNIIQRYLTNHKQLYLNFIDNRQAIEQYKQDYHAEYPDEMVLKYSREILTESAKRLTETKEDFKKNNPDILKFVKESFKEIMKPE